MYRDLIGVVGLNSRAVAESAKKLGFIVYLVDYFSDSDVSADKHFFLQRNPLRPKLSAEYSTERLAESAIENLDGIVDSLILTSGIGCNFNTVRKLEKHFKILGNGSKKIKNSKDWKNIKKILDRTGVSYPETIVAGSVKGIKGAANKLGYPVVAKSMTKDAGILPRLIRNETEMENFCMIIKSKFKDADILVQDFIDGIPISASVLSDGGNAISLSINRQLIGVKEFGVLRDFTYCGHIVPWGNGINKDVIGKFSEEIISGLKLQGSNGIDYVLSNTGEVFFMEVNPRFQDTICSVEKFCRINLVEKHLKAIDGILEHPEDCSRMYYGKGIVFADKRMIVSGLRRISNISNIPHDGTVIQGGDPICSIFAGGGSNADVMNKLSTQVKRIRSLNLP